MYNISYNEMLVLYTLREFDFCTQKQIYDSYMLPRQAINYNIRGTDSKAMNKDKISTMAKLVLEFNNILNLFLNEKV